MTNLDDPTLEPAAASAPVPASPFLRLVFSGTKTTARDIPLEAARIDVGRAVTGPEDILLDQDPRLSRHHATFISRGGQVRVKNASVHGTWVNRQRLGEGEECTLSDGDVLRLGDSFFVLRFIPDNPRDAAIPTVLGKSPAILKLRTLIDVVGPTRASVLLLGETGAGKEVAARALHLRSGLSGPFVPVNCAAIPENLAESQLFGHKAGSFTGAHKDHIGFFREAQGGTLFLDELGELPLALQPKLLRVLDERQVYPVGATAGVPVNVRVVAATNRHIASDVEQGSFRGDLFARLAEITVSLPPLRARMEDVVLLLQAAVPALGAGEMMLSAQLVHAMLLHSWPFNVRELVKIGTELELKAQGRALLDVDLLEGRVFGIGLGLTPPGPPETVSSPPVPIADPEAERGAARKSEVPAPTREVLAELLVKHRGRISDIARATGRSRTQVYRWLEEHGLALDRFRS